MQMARTKYAPLIDTNNATKNGHTRRKSAHIFLYH